MSTERRKGRRRREIVRAASGARDLARKLELAERAAQDRLADLVVAERELGVARSQVGEALVARNEAQEDADRLRIVAKMLDAEIKDLRDSLRERDEVCATQLAHLKRLEAEDRDLKKLRRRLEEKSVRLSEAHTEMNRLRKELERSAVQSVDVQLRRAR